MSNPQGAAGYTYAEGRVEAFRKAATMCQRRAPAEKEETVTAALIASPKGLQFITSGGTSVALVSMLLDSSVMVLRDNGQDDLAAAVDAILAAIREQVGPPVTVVDADTEG